MALGLQVTEKVAEAVVKYIQDGVAAATTALEDDFTSNAATQIAVVEMLLSYGGDINARDSKVTAVSAECHHCLHEVSNLLHVV